MKTRHMNWPIWAGFLLSLAALGSYPLFFAQFPVTRDFPWANLLLFGAAAFGHYPYLLPSISIAKNGLTIYDASASSYGLRIGLVWFIPGLTGIGRVVLLVRLPPHCRETGYRDVSAGQQSILMDPHSSHQEIVRKRELYRSGLEANGYSTEGREIPIARFIALANNASAAEDVARRGAQWLVASYARQEPPQMRREGVPLHAEIVSNTPERYLNGVVIYGTPDAVCDELARLRETMSLEYILCAPLSHESFLLFTDKVLPRIGSSG